ncbi:MAG: type II secretion system protein [Candidatus Omnitrophica bacterium]|nr:type II secretion system protein [Candidatus Omnitrophota bacterium]
MTTRKIQAGFTLVELIVVLTIISIVAAIVASSALAARVQANEGAVRGALKTVQSASISYRSSQGAYAVSLAALGSSYLGGGLESGDKSGYRFELKAGNQGETYTCTAVPKTANFTGVRSYCTDVFNAIYLYDNAPGLTADGSSCPPGGTALAGG